MARRNIVLDRMAQLNVISQADADAAQGQRARPHDHPHPQRLRVLHGAVLLRLRAPLPAGRPGARQDRRGPRAAAQLRRPDHQDHRRPALPGGRRQGGQPRTSDPTDQAIGALAMVEPGTGNVQAIAQSRPMGREKKQGQTFLNYVVRQQVRRLRRLPGRLDVQAVRARRRARAGHPALDQIQLAAADRTSRRTPSRTATAPTQHRRPEPATTRPSSGTIDIYTGTQHSVNTFFAQLERKTGLCEPYSAGQGDGRRADRPRPRAGAVLHPRRRRRQPAGDGRAYATSPPAACTATPAGHPDPEQRRQGVQELPDAAASR